jgi:hypothetical protein
VVWEGGEGEGFCGGGGVCGCEGWRHFDGGRAGALVDGGVKEEGRIKSRGERGLNGDSMDSSSNNSQR